MDNSNVTPLHPKEQNKKDEKSLVSSLSPREIVSELDRFVVGQNKAKKAVEVFDYIHSLDSQKLADILSKCQTEINKSINYFIQVNIGKEQQKSGIPYNEVDAFFNYCTKEKKMNVLGLMAIPPNDKNTEKHFKSLSELNASLGLKELSMGMSSDYMLAARFHATFLRIGSSIFGDRA